jgi:metacaspase-1
MTNFALCIGINDYPGTREDLAGCVNDARDWSAEFKRRGFKVSTLVNRQATKKGIRSAIAALLDVAVRGDQIVVQFSGHGSVVPDRNRDEKDGMDECLCPYDVKRNGPITDDDLFDLFAAKAAGVHVVMIADSCNSGTLDRFRPLSTPASARGGGNRGSVRFLPPATFLSSAQLAAFGSRRTTVAASPPGRNVSLTLSGCRETELSYDAYFQGRPNGAFTYIALRELAKLPATATYIQWHRRIRAKLPTRQFPQSPGLYGSSSMKRWKVFGQPDKAGKRPTSKRRSTRRRTAKR